MEGKRVLLLFFCVFLTAPEAVFAVSNSTSAGEQLEALDARTIGGAYGGGRKRFDVITSVEISWVDALNYCKKRHTDLATIRSQEENDALVNLLNRTGLFQANNVISFWIGGTSNNSQKGYFWITDGETVNNYVNWHTGEPSIGGNENCMTYLYAPPYYATKAVKWNNSPCTGETYFVCEYYI